jgi:hypothetical protein
VFLGLFWMYNSIQEYGSALSAYGLMFLAGHFLWSFSLMFLFAGRGVLAGANRVDRLGTR